MTIRGGRASAHAREGQVRPTRGALPGGRRPRVAVDQHSECCVERRCEEAETRADAAVGPCAPSVCAPLCRSLSLPPTFFLGLDARAPRQSRNARRGGRAQAPPSEPPRWHGSVTTATAAVANGWTRTSQTRTPAALRPSLLTHAHVHTLRRPPVRRRNIRDAHAPTARRRALVQYDARLRASAAHSRLARIGSLRAAPGARRDAGWSHLGYQGLGEGGSGRAQPPPQAPRTSLPSRPPPAHTTHRGQWSIAHALVRSKLVSVTQTAHVPSAPSRTAHRVHQLLAPAALPSPRPRALEPFGGRAHA